MRNASVLLLAAQFTCSVFCFGQIKMQLQDDSVQAGPLRVSGVVSFEDTPSNVIRYSYQIEGSIANLSSKGVVLIIIHFGSTGVNGPGLDYTYQKDYFFSSDILQPGKTESFRSSPLRFGRPTVNGHPVPEDNTQEISPPLATAKVVFVQFIDGSTWGDANNAHEALLVRNQTLRELGRLESALNQKGEGALKDELVRSDNLLPCIGSVVSSCDDKPASCVVDYLHSMIEAARQHEIEINMKSVLVRDVL